MDKNWKIHECEKHPVDGIEILYSMDNKFRKSMTWQLVIRREATEQDLESNNNFEEVGDTIWETFLEITHCPYCGEFLLQKNDEQYEDIGKFVHIDYSEWDTKGQ